MNQTQSPNSPLAYRLDEISALDTGKVAAVLSLLGAIGYSIHLVQAFDSPSFSKGLAIVGTALVGITLAGFVGGLILATLYNVLSRYTGGLRIRLSPVDAKNSMGIDATGTKQCPQCQAQVRADRSFCPECDHTFPKQTEEQ